ncbi:MAG: hypothetical protein MAG451_00117 [Anaerolineales bacterium]|nr:hypothetical protein [Anaerolineales bacterium]
MRLKQRLEANPHPSIQLSLRYSLLRMLVNELSIIGNLTLSSYSACADRLRNGCRDFNRQARQARQAEWLRGNAVTERTRMNIAATRDAIRHTVAGADPERQRGTLYALVIGVDRYEPPIRPLSYAVKDATAVAERLRDDFGFQVTLLTNSEATGTALRRVLEGWRATTQPPDSALVFFAGHGMSDHERAQSPAGYLLPADATDDASSWLAESDIVDVAKHMPASWVFLIFDACYAGTTFRHDIPTGARDDQVLKALVAGTEDQPVLDGGAGEHSIFTRAMLDGLDGWADSGQRPDDVISADELIVYVQSEVPWRSRLRDHEQTPVGGPLQGSRLARDFELRPVRARLPAPLLRNIYSPSAEDRVAAAQQLGRRAPTDTKELVANKEAELVRLMIEDEALAVEVAAARSLGTLGHPDGCRPLIDLLHDTAANRELRAAAANALGDLGQMDACQADAVAALLDTLRSTDSAVLEAAKQGLAKIPESTPRLRATLDTAAQDQKEAIIDALACVAVAHPDDDGAWPALDGLNTRLWHRTFVANRRLRSRWRDLRRQAVAVAVSGALGLSAGYLIIILGLRPFNPYVPAVFSYNLLPGAMAGISLVLVPHIIRTSARRPAGMATWLGALIGGLLLGIGMGLPNWFLRIGPDWVAWFVPAVVSGILVSLALAFVPLPVVALDSRERLFTSVSEMLSAYAIPYALVALTGGLSFALLRVPEAFAWRGDPQSAQAVVLRFGIGGAIFATALALGWSLSLTETNRGESDEVSR